MAYCIKCGTKLPEDASFCPACGAAAAAEPANNQNAGQAAENQQNPNFAKAQQAFGKFMDTADETGGIDPRDIAVNKGLAILAYIGPLVFIPYFVERNSKFVRFHAVQGMYLFCVDVVFGIVSAVLGLVRLPFLFSGHVQAVITWPFLLVQLVLGAVTVAYSVLGIINAANGKAKELPVIGTFGRAIGIFK